MKQLTQQELNALKPGAQAYYVTLEGTHRLQLLCEHPDNPMVQVFQCIGQERRIITRFKDEDDGEWFGGGYDASVLLAYEAALHEDKAEEIRATIEIMRKNGLTL